MANTLRISAVIPTRDRPNDLDAAVASVLAQQRLPDQLLIVDQSRTEESRRRIEERIGRSAQRLALVYIHNSAITGLVHAKQVGAARCQGDIVMFLEDDIVLEPDYVRNLEAGFIEHPDMLGCAGVVTTFEKTSRFYRFVFNLFHRGIFADPRIDVQGVPARWSGRLIPSTHLSGGISAFRSVVLETVPFDTQNGFHACEDIEYSMRAARYFGRERFFINTSVRLHHKLSEVNRDLLASRYARKFREYVLLYKKNRDVSGVAPQFAWLLCGLFLEAAREAARMRSPGPVAGSIRGFWTGVQSPLRSC